jgi:Helix-turn-helix domain
MERRAAIEEAVAHLPLMLTVEQAREVLGIGRSLAYGEVRRYLATDGREGIPAVRIGSAIRIPRAGLVDLMLAAPAPDASCPVALHAVTPTRSLEQPRARRSRSSRPSGAGEVAQLPFAEPTGS